MTVIQEGQETQTALRDFGRWLLQSGGLPADKTKDLLTKSRALHCRSGETVFSAGDTLEELFFVNSGLVRYYYLTPDGKEYNKNFVSSGSVVTSLSSFLEAKPAPFFTEALEDTVLVAVPIELARNLASDDIDWERLVGRFVRALAIQKEQREASFLLKNAEQRYEAFLKDFSALAMRLPQYHIASYLGITPVALSRIRSRLACRRLS